MSKNFYQDEDEFSLTAILVVKLVKKCKNVKDSDLTSEGIPIMSQSSGLMRLKMY